MKNKTYIVQNLNFAAPYPGNLMRSVWNLEQRCKEMGIEFVYCFPEIARRISWVDEMIRQGKMVYFKPTKVNLKFWKNIIKKYEPIGIHTHFWNLRDSSMIRLATMFNRKKRLILHHHSTYFESGKRCKEILKRMIIKSDIHIACGIALGHNLNKMRFKNVVTIENAIDFSRLDAYVLLNRKEYDIDDDATVFLMFGHDIHIKGVDIAIRALNDFCKDKKATLCVVVASDLVKAKQILNDKVGEIPSWVKFLPPRDDIATYYRFADVFLSPSRHEGFCYALPEAAYSGCHIVFSKIDGQMHAMDIPESVCFESESAESLHEQIKMILNNEKSDAAKGYVIDRYDLSKWSEKICNVYKNL